MNTERYEHSNLYIHLHINIYTWTAWNKPVGIALISIAVFVMEVFECKCHGLGG